MTTLEKIQKTAQCATELLVLSDEKIALVLNQIAEKIAEKKEYLLEENQKDLSRMSEDDPKYDRLLLTKERLVGIASAIRELAEQKSPVGKILEEKTLENGIKLKKIRVPMGVLGIIFEARPNVFFDCFALSFKTKNCCVLKGSRDAENSNTAIFKLIQGVLENNNISKEVVCFPNSSHESLDIMMSAHGLIEVIIPRGGKGLIKHVRENSLVPVIETGAGIVHTYLDKNGDNAKAKEIIFNAKTHRVSVCNALDSLIVHSEKLPFLGEILAPLSEKSVEIFADERAFSVLKDYPKLKKATEKSFGTEFLDYKLSVKTVDSLEEAMEHIAKHSSRHTEAIISENKKACDEFALKVDASTIFINASTRFTDGGVFGLGAEIGISTQKLHARGPMGAGELCTYKWIGEGEGQIRR